MTDIDDNDPALARLIDRIRSAAESGTPLCIRGDGTKDFYGEAPRGELLDTTELCGISSHEPTELVVTARCGTPLAELEAALAEKGQCLPFEPPHFSGDTPEATTQGGTVGGMIAAGLSGPSRAALGAVRDYVLGATLLNGRGEVLSFGGQVIKNVAGYDVSRLLVGSLGTLGVILEVSIKVLPIAPATTTLRFDLDATQALAQLHRWGGQPLPLNASALWNGMLVVRLRGAAAAVQAATSTFQTLGGEVIGADLADPFWAGLRDHRDEFFVAAREAVQAGGALWRLSVPQTAPMLALPGTPLIEWAGAQRWCVTPNVLPETVAHLRGIAQRAGGHATLYRSRDKSAGVFAPLASPLDRIHRELKRSFDPHGVFNPGRLYPGL
ncbi:MAG: glycolate oxidase subunit GlcE [Rhizobacter sp.]